METIQLSQGKIAIVDSADFELLNQRKWYLSSGYAARGSKGKLLLMHRVIMQTPQGLCTDHINGNGLDNRRSNLRVCTYAQNNHNRTILGKNNKSGYKGVSFIKKEKRWYSFIVVNGKTMYLGSFLNPEDAAHTYDDAAKKLFGEFAKLNFE